MSMSCGFGRKERTTSHKATHSLIVTMMNQET